MPTEKCGKCEGDITQPKEFIKCTDCSASFHLACSRSATGDTGKKVSTRTSYKCDGCVSENSSISSKHGQDQYSVLDAIATLRKENAEMFGVIRRESSEMWTLAQKKLDKVESDIGLVTSDISEMKQKLGSMEKKVADTDDSVRKLEEQNLDLKDEVRDLKSEINEIQQYSRIDNIVITGIPVMRGEDIYLLLSGIAKVLRLKFDRYDISSAHRLSTQNQRGRPPAIVVKFTSRSIKHDWIHARREKNILRANEIHNSFPDSTVYFNEHLTAHTRDVFNIGRQLVKENKLAFVWVNDGRVLVKQTPTGKTIRVREVAAMQHLGIVIVQPTPRPDAAGPNNSPPTTTPAAPETPTTLTTP